MLFLKKTMLTNSKNVESINQGRKVETCSSEILQIPAAYAECRAGDCVVLILTIFSFVTALAFRPDLDLRLSPGL